MDYSNVYIAEQFSKNAHLIGIPNNQIKTILLSHDNTIDTNKLNLAYSYGLNKAKKYKNDIKEIEGVPIDIIEEEEKSLDELNKIFTQAPLQKKAAIKINNKQYVEPPIVTPVVTSVPTVVNERQAIFFITGTIK